MTTDDDDGGGFPAFRRRVAEERALAALLRPILERDALAAASVAEGAARGFRFTAAEVAAAMDANRHGWLTPPSLLPPFGDADGRA